MSVDARPLVMHVIHHLLIGGMENGLVNLINHLPEGEFRHVVVCVEDYSDFRLRIRRADVEVIALHRSRIGVGALRRELYALCRRLKPAIVHTRNLSGLDAIVPAFLARVPARVHSEHGWDVDNLDGRQWKPALLRRLHRPFVHRYVTVSTDLARFLQKRIGVAPARITTICNGVDTARFEPQLHAALPALPPGFDGPGVLRFGTVGRLQAVKDQASLLAALAELVKRRPELRACARLVIVGDGPLRTELAQKAAALGVTDLTHFAGASDDVPAWLRAMHVFVLPSLNEGISNTLLEAMASGLPTLVTAVGGNVELVQEGQGGGFFKPGDVATLATRLTAYFDDEALRQRDAAAARARCEAQFSLRAMVDAYAALYRSLAAGS
jgi:sugar transferase (PEP-CTERM/EpsH1 system associated)